MDSQFFEQCYDILNRMHMLLLTIHGKKKREKGHKFGNI